MTAIAIQVRVTFGVLLEIRRAFNFWWRKNHAAGEAGETVYGLKVRFLGSRI